MDIEAPRLPPPPPPPRANAIDHVGAWLGGNWRACLIVVAILVTGWQSIVILVHTLHRHPQTQTHIKPSLCSTTVVVAKDGDGTGSFRSISEALESIPSGSGRSSDRFCIRITRGEYIENIIVGIEKTNVVFLGDGINETIITGHHDFDFGSGVPLRVDGDGFIAKDLTIVSPVDHIWNYSALENRSFKSIFLRCRFVGYRRTVDVYMGRQLYRDCIIEGAEYMVVGRVGRAFLQKCQVKVVKVHQSDVTVITGQSDSGAIIPAIIPASDGGFVFHECRFSVINWTATFGRTYVVYPFASSVTVFMQSFFFAPSITGWLMDESVAARAFVGEYDNHGLGGPNGSSLIQRLTPNQASIYTLTAYIGTSWIPHHYIPFDAYLV